MTVIFRLISGTLPTPLQTSCGLVSNRPEKQTLFCNEERFLYHDLRLIKKFSHLKEQVNPTVRLLVNVACCDYLREVWIKPKTPEVGQTLYAERVDRLTHPKQIKLSLHQFPELKPTKVSNIADDSSIRESTMGLDGILIGDIRNILTCFLDDPETIELALSFPDGRGSIATHLWIKG
ncbi:MAG TPA: hypothetical protein VIJ14_07080 [Rhabdochlamydiaceae bacterium]